MNLFNLRPIDARVDCLCNGDLTFYQLLPTGYMHTIHSKYKLKHGYLKKILNVTQKVKAIQIIIRTGEH